MAVARFSARPLSRGGLEATHCRRRRPEPHRNEPAESNERMRTQEVRKKGHKSELGFSMLVSFLIFLASLFIHPPPALDNLPDSRLFSQAGRALSMRPFDSCGCPAAERRQSVATAEGRGIRFRPTNSRGAAKDSDSAPRLVRMRKSVPRPSAVATL